MVNLSYRSSWALMRNRKLMERRKEESVEGASVTRPALQIPCADMLMLADGDFDGVTKQADIALAHLSFGRGRTRRRRPAPPG
jgi:hypothetical protein